MSCATIVCSVSLPKERNHWNNETEAEIFANMEKIIEKRHKEEQEKLMERKKRLFSRVI